MNEEQEGDSDNEEDDMNMLVVGLVFQQQESVKSDMNMKEHLCDDARWQGGLLSMHM